MRYFSFIFHSILSWMCRCYDDTSYWLFPLLSLLFGVNRDSILLRIELKTEFATIWSKFVVKKVHRRLANRNNKWAHPTTKYSRVTVVLVDHTEVMVTQFNHRPTQHHTLCLIHLLRSLIFLGDFFFTSFLFGKRFSALES